MTAGAGAFACAAATNTITAFQVLESGRKNGLSPGGAAPDWDEWAQDTTFEVTGNLVGKTPAWASAAFGGRPGVGYNLWDFLAGTLYDIPDWWLIANEGVVGV